MHQTLKHFLMYGSMLALVATTACSSMEASLAGEGSDGATATQVSSNDLLHQMDRDSQAGGE